MRVVCSTVDEFLTILMVEVVESPEGSQEKTVSRVYRKTVYLSRTTRKLHEACVIINIQVSAIIDTEDGGQYLIQAGQECGQDLLDGQEERIGTEVFDVRRKKVEDCCKGLGLKIMPGIVDF